MLQINVEALIVIVALYQSRCSHKRVLGLLHPEYEGKMIL
jgi:hypothetical protein